MDRADRHLILWWGVLVALTIFSFQTSWGPDWLRSPTTALGLIIGVAMFKVRIVMLHFMELRDAPWQLRAPAELWIVAIAAAILGFWLGK